MSKICEVCKLPYPDDRQSCPHCAARDEGDVRLDAPEKAAGPPRVSDSEVDLGREVAGESGLSSGGMGKAAEPSGASVVQWAELVEEPGPGEVTPAARVDAPSDLDLIGQARPAEIVGEEKGDPVTLPPAPPLGENVLLEDVQVLEDAAEPSGVRLGEPPAAAAAPPEDHLPETIHPGAFADLAGSVRGDSPDEDLIGTASLEGDPLAAAGIPPVEPSGSDSGVDLAEDLVHTKPDDGGSGRDLIAEEVESGVGLGDPVSDVSDEEMEGIHAPVVTEGASVISSAVDLGGDQGRHALDPAELESQIRSGEEMAKRPPGPRSSTFDLGDLPAEVQEEAKQARNESKRQDTSSSEIDLGSQMDLGQFPGGTGPSSGSGSQDVLIPVSSSDLDLDATHDPGARPPTQRVSPSQMHEVVREQTDDGDDFIEPPEEQGAGGEEPPSPPPSGRKSTAFAWAGGGLAGALVGAGACLALWFAGILPHGSKPNEGTTAPVTPARTNDHQAEIAQLTERVNDLQAKLKAAEEKVASTDPKPADNAKDVQAARDEAEAARKEVAAAKKGLADATKAADDARKENEELKGQLAKAEKVATDADKKIQEAQGLAKSAEKKLNEMGRATEAKVKEEVAKATTKLEVNITQANKKQEELLAQLQKAKDQSAQGEARLKAAADREKELLAYSDLVTKAVGSLSKGGYLAANAAKEDILSGIDEVIKQAKSQDPQGAVRKMAETVEQLKRQLKASRKPAELLALYPALLQDRADKDLASRAAADAESVMADSDAKLADKARARFVLALAQRNQGRYDQAKKTLEQARGELGEDKSWLRLVEMALPEVADPASYYAKGAAELTTRGKAAEALALLDQGLESLPGDKNPLLAQRSLVHLEAARRQARGSLRATDPEVVAARQDAEAAAKAGLAEGHYAAGRIAEALDQWDLAAKEYRQAVSAHPSLDGQGGRYRGALLRAVMRSQKDKQAPAKEAEPADSKKTGRLNPADLFDRVVSLAGRGPQTREVLALLLTAAIQDPPASDEAQKLAREILDAPPGTVPFEVRAQALLALGQSQKALDTYVQGLRPYLSRDHVEGLLEILHSDRPKQPVGAVEPPTVANLLDAEQHYAAGLRDFFSRRYAEAEEEFQASVSQDNQDARFFYFLGLARLMQNKPGANEDFDQGARLEYQDRPGRAAVNSALERVQGRNRQLLNAVREQPR